jgi:hypothetical protein
MDCSRPADTQPYLGSCGPLEGVEWSPAPDSDGAPTDSTIRVVFDDYPDPDSLAAGDLLLTTGVFYYTGTYAVDLINKAVIFRPAGSLRTNLGYTVTISPPLRSLSGCEVKMEQKAFRTGDGPGAPAPAAAVAFTAVQPIIAARCGGAGCHREAPETGGGCLAAPAEGLSLCDTEAIDALVGVPSREVGHLPLVEPNDSARSYLLRKLLPAPGGGPIPTVLGHRDPPGDPLTPDELATVARWIDSGARQ